MHVNPWKGVTLATTLVLGLAAGVLVDRFVLLPAVAGDAVRGRSGHEDHRQRFRDRLRQELDLTTEQEARLEEVLDRHHETAEGFWRDSRREFDALRMTFRQDIREVLTEAQREAFDRMLAEFDEKRRNHEDER